MADEIKNQNEINSNDDSTELKPVKGTFKKVLSIGATIAVGGVVIGIISPVFLTTRTMGASRTTRLNQEQKKAEIQQQLAEEVQKEIDEKQ